MFAKEIYNNRRARIKEKMPNGIALIMGNGEASMNYTDNTYHFRQDSTFLYFFGLDYAGLAGVIDFESGEELLFGDDITVEDIVWMGPLPKLAENAKAVGINKTYPFAKLKEVVQKAIQQGRKVHFTPPYRGHNMITMGDILNIHPAKVKDSSSLEFTKACITMRSVKEPCEIEVIEGHMNVAYQMHTTAMKMAQPGRYEYEISGALEGISASGGGMVSFPVICTVRGETLHNHYHGNILKKNDLMLVDAGSESMMHYATDHTRTSPVGGKFTTLQKDMYNIILDAMTKSMEATKPGITYKEVHLIACKVLASGLKDAGLMKGDIDEAVAQGAHALFFQCGLGHMMGMDVHDMEDYNDTLVGYDDEVKRSSQFGLSALRMGRKLEKGFVLTNEPGLYFIPALIDQWKAENKLKDFINYDKVEQFRDFGGIRMEDDVLVTEDGYRLLGERIPITTEEVEAMVNSGK